MKHISYRPETSATYILKKDWASLCIDLFHDGDILISSFIGKIINLSDLVCKEELFCILHMLARSERLHVTIIHIKDYINGPPS